MCLVVGDPMENHNERKWQYSDKADTMTENVAITTPCDSCQDDEHSECEIPQATKMEWDTGYHYVTRCCCSSDEDL